MRDGNTEPPAAAGAGVAGLVAELKSYPAMKNSGLPWLGSIPSTWDVRRNGRLFIQRNETGFPNLPILEVSLRTGVRVRNFEESNRKQVMSDREKYKRACAGDIAYNMMRMWQGAVGVAPIDGLVSPAYVVARALVGTEARYYQHVFRTAAYMNEVNKFSRGIVSDRNRLYWEDFKQMPSPFPPPDEQAAIVRFLDHVDRRIRRYIRAKQKLIALLEEQKQAIIHRAVTRGLDPSVRMKHSGAEWLGEVPEHWQLLPLKRACSVLRDGTHLPPPRQTEGFPLLSVRNIVADNFVRRSDDSYIAQAHFDELSRSFVPQQHDVLLAIVGATLGKVAIVPEMEPFQIQRSLAVLRPRPQLLSRHFLAAFLRSPAFQRALWTTVAFSAQPGIYLSTLGAFRVPLPPLAEQQAIVDQLDRSTVRMAGAISRAGSEISLLREYRTRLIADVVTGKLDVRAAAAELPAQVDEVAAADEEEPGAGGDDGEVVDETPSLQA